MSVEEALRVSIAADTGEPTQVLLARLSPAEQDLVRHLPTERQRRQSATARIAGRLAVRRSLGNSLERAPVEILSGSHGEPLASVGGDTEIVSISLAHSGSLAAAYAWRNSPDNGIYAGVDLEFIRSNEVAWSSYAFSMRERKLIANTRADRGWLGLVAWSAKEAAWKALSPAKECGPDTVELCKLDVRHGTAVVKPRGALRHRWHGAAIASKFKTIEGPDGAYILSVATLESVSHHGVARNYGPQR